MHFSDSSLLKDRMPRRAHEEKPGPHWRCDFSTRPQRRTFDGPSRQQWYRGTSNLSVLRTTNRSPQSVDTPGRRQHGQTGIQQQMKQSCNCRHVVRHRLEGEDSRRYLHGSYGITTVISHCTALYSDDKRHNGQYSILQGGTGPGSRRPSLITVDEFRIKRQDGRTGNGQDTTTIDKLSSHRSPIVQPVLRRTQNLEQRNVLPSC